MAVQLHLDSSHSSSASNAKIKQNPLASSGDEDVQSVTLAFNKPDAKQDKLQQNPQSSTSQDGTTQNNAGSAPTEAELPDETTDLAMQNHDLYSFSQSLLANNFKTQKLTPDEKQTEEPILQRPQQQSEIELAQLIPEQVTKKQTDEPALQLSTEQIQSLTEQSLDKLSADQAATPSLKANEEAMNAQKNNQSALVGNHGLTQTAVTPELQTEQLITPNTVGATQIQSAIKNESSNGAYDVRFSKLASTSDTLANGDIQAKPEKTRSAELSAQLIGSANNKDESHDFFKATRGMLSTTNEPKELLHSRLTPALFPQVEQSAASFQWRKEDLTSSPAQWGQRLLHVLSDKVSLQIGQNIQKAQIRLDPPQLGSIDISISIDGDKTVVNLVASNAQVRDAMQQTLDQLRQSFSQEQQVTVNVDINDKQQSNDSAEHENESITDNLLVDDPQNPETKQTHKETDWLNRLV